MYRRMCVGADSQTQTGVCRGEMAWKTISINASVPFSTEKKRVKAEREMKVIVSAVTHLGVLENPELK